MAKAAGPFTKQSLNGTMRPPTNNALYASKVPNEGGGVLNWLMRDRRRNRK